MNLEDVNANGILDAGEDTNNNGQLDYHQNYQTISIIPKLTIAVGQSGKIGDTFTVSGVGFASSENVDIKLTDDNVELAAGTFPTDANGKFSSSTFTINQQTFGDKKILAIGRNSSLTAVGDQTISVLNQISSANPTTGNNVYVGEIINLTGDGWGSEEAITVAVTKFKGAVLGQPLVVQTATTQVNGALSVGFPVPSLGDVGTFTIEVTGETSNSQTHVRRDGV